MNNAPAPRQDYEAARIAAPTHLGQATAVEQSRAVAQVQAAVVMARQFPRSEQRAIAQMRDACGREELAQRAFFKFARSGSTVTGATVYLARELGRIWGNLDYGLNEMSRNDDLGQSELQAYAWDLETNARSTRTFIVEHGRDTKQGRKKLTDLRDIAENNNNFGARNVREMIFAVLPQWFTDMAQAECSQTLKVGGGKPLPVRIDEVTAQYGRARVTKEQLEARVGRPVEEWTHEDAADLEILFGSLSRREISRDEAFPPKPVTAEELVGTPAAKPAARSRARVQPEPQPTPAEDVDPDTGEVFEGEVVADLPDPADTRDPWADNGGAA